MKVTKEVQQTVTVVKDIICNKCGESCRTDGGGDDTSHPEFDGLIEAQVHGGYFSEKIGDCSRHIFSLCETCFMDLQSTFKIPSYQGDWLGDCSLDMISDEELAEDNND